MRIYFIYPIYTAVLATILIVLVPREQIRKLAIYGVLFGGIGDVFAIILLTHLLNVGAYTHFGPFGFAGIPFFPPLAWSVWFIMFFYFMPEKWLLKLLFIVTAAGYAVFFSNVLENLDIFQWNKGHIFWPFIIYIVWFISATLGKPKFDTANT